MKLHLEETTTGGSAGKGLNKTASFKIVDSNGKRIGRYFRFWVGSSWSKKTAKMKAEAVVDYEIRKESHCVS